MSNLFCPTSNCGRIFCWTGNLAEMEWKPVYCHPHSNMGGFLNIFLPFVYLCYVPSTLNFCSSNLSIFPFIYFFFLWSEFGLSKPHSNPWLPSLFFCTFAQFQFSALHIAHLRGVWDALASLGSILEIQWVGEWVMFLRFGRPLPDIAFRLPQHFVNVRF